MERNPGLDQAASNLGNICGVLAGFTCTLIILLLTPGILPANDKPDEELAVAMLLGACAFYIAAALLLSSVPHISVTACLLAQRVGLLLFLLADVLFAENFSVVLSALDLPEAALVAKVLTLLALLGLGYALVSPLLVPWLRRRAAAPPLEGVPDDPAP